MNAARTLSTDSPRIEASGLRYVLLVAAERPAAMPINSFENKGENGGRDRDRTCDPSRVKGVLSR